MRRLFMFLAVSMFLGACYPPVTTHPVGRPEANPALNGLWTGKDEDGHPVHMIFLPKAAGNYHVLMAQGGDEENSWFFLEAQGAEAGTRHYLNARLVLSDGTTGDDTPKLTIPVLYRTGNGTLTLFLPDEAKTKAEIRAGRIAGDAGKTDSSDAVIASDQNTLERIFGGPEADRLFAKPFLILHRPK